MIESRKPERNIDQLDYMVAELSNRAIREMEVSQDTELQQARRLFAMAEGVLDENILKKIPILNTSTEDMAGKLRDEFSRLLIEGGITEKTAYELTELKIAQARIGTLKTHIHLFRG